MKVQELGHIVLYVSSLERSSHFYRGILGFPEIGRLSGAALFSGGRTHHELLLIEIGGEPGGTRSQTPGLYHIGFKIGDTKEELISACEELKKAGVRIIGATDHTVTHSLYVLDPDNNELELYIDITDAWRDDVKLILSPPKQLSYINL